MSSTITAITRTMEGGSSMARPEIKVSEECVRTFDAREEDGMRQWVRDEVTSLKLKIKDLKAEQKWPTSRWQYQVRPTKVAGHWRWEVWLVEYDATGNGDEAGTVTVVW